MIVPKAQVEKKGFPELPGQKIEPLHAVSSELEKIKSLIFCILGSISCWFAQGYVFRHVP